MYRVLIAAGPWSIVLWGTSGWFVANAALLTFSPSEMASPPSFPPDPHRAVTPTGELLGETTLDKTRFSVSEIRLVGLLAQGQRGAVLLSIRNGPTKTLIAGARVREGWMLEAVDASSIRISHYGSVFELPTPRPTKGLSATP